MKQMTRKQYIEKLEEYDRELWDMDGDTLDEFILDAELRIKSERNRKIFLAGMEQGLGMAIGTLKNL